MRAARVALALRAWPASDVLAQPRVRVDRAGAAHRLKDRRLLRVYVRELGVAAAALRSGVDKAAGLIARRALKPAG